MKTKKEADFLKKFFIMLLALIMLCSCAGEEQPGREIPENTNPVPEVYLGGDNAGITKFGYEWDVDNGDGTRSNTIACGIHPLQCEDIYNMHVFGETEMELVFEEDPVSYELIRYEVESDRRINGLEFTGNEVSEPVETEDDIFKISNDGKTYVYVLDAEYKNGKCQYGFELYSPLPTVERYILADTLEDGKLLVAKESGGLSTLNIDDTPVFLDGEPADASVLQDGMQMQIKHSGYMMESYPSIFGGVYEIHVFSRGSKNDPMGTYFDICGLYTKVLCDLWQADEGLNDGAEIVNIDLSKVPGRLSDGQKEAILYMFGQEMRKLGGETIWPISMTEEELLENGYLAPYGDVENAYWFEKGVSLSIADFDYGEDQAESYSLPVVHFNATKWRSPLGSYVFYDCKAVWPQNGTWSDYTVGSEMIS